MGRLRCRTLRKGVSKLANLLVCCLRGESTDREPAGPPPTSRTVRQHAAEPPPCLVRFHEYEGIDTSTHDRNLNHRYLPEWDECYPPPCFSRSQSVPTFFPFYSLPQWESLESLTGGVVSHEGSCVTLSESNASESCCDIADSADFALDRLSPIEEVNEELEILEQQSVAAADDNDDETSAVNVTIILSLNEKHDVEKDDREILTAILTDGHYDISSDDRFVLESVLTTLNMPSQFTTAVAKDVKVSEDKNEITSPLAIGDDVEANDCAVLQPILSDGRYNISAKDRSALDSVIITLYGGSM